jgi:hypothetical protein
MNNHYHLVIETPDGNLSNGMKQLNGVFTQALNRTYKRVGHVFQGRYKAILIQKENNMLEVCRYVVLNPIRAGIVEYLDQWTWSSYRATAGRGKPHSCLKTDWILGQFGGSRRLAERSYREFIKEGIKAKNIWKGVKGQSILGDEGFVEQVIKHVKKYEEVKEIPKEQRFLNRPELEEIFQKEVIRNRRKRNGKIKEAVENHGYSQKEIAHYLQMHYSTVSRLLKEQKEISKLKT